jgi:hypothetical protein
VRPKRYFACVGCVSSVPGVRVGPGTRTLIAVSVLAAAGCSDGAPEERAEKPRLQQAAAPPAASPPPPADAGRAAGHAADASRVSVPRRDPTPPTALVTLAGRDGATLGEATRPGGRDHGGVVRLREPRVRGTTTGRDEDGGVARVRVSVSERIACRPAGGRRTFVRLRTRYIPPPQVERIRSSPGTRLPTRRSRSVVLRLAGDRCGAAEPVAVRGELWGEVINGNGLEAVTPHVRFAYGRGR